MKIIGIMLLKNEEIWLQNVIENVIEFCDKLIILDNNSDDMTWEIIRKMQRLSSKIYSKKIESVAESHSYISGYAGTNTWIFAVDGDELYDPIGLKQLKKELNCGKYNHVWNLKGNVLHCISIDKTKKIANGYLTPPSRSITKLYNFRIIKKWDQCPERLHSGELIFLDDYTNKILNIYNELDWDESHFRCLHLCFIKRSNIIENKSRLNPSEIMVSKKYLLFKILKYFQLDFLNKTIFRTMESTYKKNNYCSGKLQNKVISQFIL